MALSVTGLRSGIAFKHNGDPYLVLSYEHIKSGRGNATIKVRVKNLRTGFILEKGFLSGASVEEAILEKENVQFLYSNAGEYTFIKSGTYEQFTVPAQLLEGKEGFLKEGLPVTLLVYDDRPISLQLPLTVELRVVETGPGVRGDSVSNVFKKAVLETGLALQVPLFIQAGDLVRLSTESGHYVERVKKEEKK